MRKKSLIFSGSFLILFCINCVSAQKIIVTPSYVPLVITPGSLKSNHFRIENNSEVPLTVRTQIEKWMMIVPDEFNLPANNVQDVTGIFWVKYGEDPNREGEIIFTAEERQASAGNTILKKEEQTKIKVVVSAPVEETPKPSEKASIKVSEKNLLEKQEGIAGESKPAKKDLTPMFNLLAKNLAEEIKKGDVLLSWINGDILITLPGRIIFNPGQSYPKQEGLDILSKIASILKNNPSEIIQIKGHADSSPIIGKLGNKYPSNWELSSIRSASTARILENKTGINGRRFVAIGYSENQPIDSNETPEGRTKNRRLEILISGE